jgi:hypothetical protein
MLNDLARDQGMTDCLAKFAIDAKGFAELERVYGHLPPEQFNAAVKTRAEHELRRDGGIMDPMGVGRSPTAPTLNQSPNVALSREQFQNMPAGEVHKTLMGRPPAGPTAGTVPGRVNPLLAKR